MSAWSGSSRTGASAPSTTGSHGRAAHSFWRRSPSGSNCRSRWRGCCDRPSRETRPCCGRSAVVSRPLSDPIKTSPIAVCRWRDGRHALPTKQDLRSSPPWQRQKSNAALGAYRADERASRCLTDLENSRQSPDECLGLLLSGEVGGGQNEGPNTRIHERLDFQLATANVTVFREHHPPALPDKGQPICVPGSLAKLGARQPDVGAVGRERSREHWTAKALVHEEDQRRRSTPPRSVRSGALPRFLPPCGHSPSPDPPVTHRP